MNSLGTIDYITLLLTLLIPCLVSFYFAPKSDSKRNLGLFPAFMSLTASTISGVSMIGLPSEAYTNGVAYTLYGITSSISSLVASVYWFLPVMYNLKIDSAYEYFELRFDTRIRKLASFLYILSQVSYAALAVYPSASVVSQFSGISMDATSLGLLIFCAFCTIIGGFKGVVWTDTFQAIVMWAFLIIFLTLSTVHGGGLTSVLSLSNESGRLDIFITDPDPTLRMSLWSGIIGLFAANLSYCILSPSAYQRYRPMKSLRKSCWALYLSEIQVSAIYLLLTFCGLGLYASYIGCDPKHTGKIDNYLNIVAYFIDEVSQNSPGLKGLFTAGLISGSLSTMSTNINTAATMIYADFLKDYPVLSKVTQSTAIRLSSVLAGIFSMAFFFLFKGTESILEVFQLFVGSVQGLLTGLFILGMFCLNSNSKGTFYGGVISLCLMMTLSLGNKLYAGALLDAPHKALSTDRCEFNASSTVVQEMEPGDRVDSPWIFRITPFYYSLIAATSTVMLGLVISWLVSVGETSSECGKRLLEKELFSPMMVKAFKYRFHDKVPLNDENQTELNVMN